MEVITILDVIIGVIVGLSIYELLFYLITTLIQETEKEKHPLDQEAKDYLQYLNSKSVAKATDQNKED